MSIKNLDHINIVAPKELLNKIRTFYINILGFEEGPRPAFKVPGFWLYQNGQAMIHLVESSAGTKLQAMGNHLEHIAFHCRDYDKMKGVLETHQIEFTQFTVPGEKARQLFFKDPSGIKIELIFIS